MAEKKIRRDFSNQNLDSIVQKLNNMNLTKRQIDSIYQYCHFPGYDEEDASFGCESDNSEFLKYVNYVFERLRNGESN